MSDAPVIFGSVTKVNEYNRQNGLKPIQTEPDKRIVSNGNSKAFQIGGDGNPDTTEVTDDELKSSDGGNLKFKNTNGDGVTITEDNYSTIMVEYSGGDYYLDNSGIACK